MVENVEGGKGGIFVQPRGVMQTRARKKGMETCTILNFRIPDTKEGPKRQANMD